MIELPPNNQWNQTNRSDILGNLMGSFNLDLTSNLGNVEVNRMIQTTTQATNTSLTSYPVGFKLFDSGTQNIWTVAGLYAHKTAGAATKAPFSVDATTGTPVDCDSTLSDIEVTGFGSATQYLCITANSKLYYRSSGNWSSTALLAGGGPWMMTNYASKLYVTISGLSKIVAGTDPTTGFGSSALTLDNNYRPTCIRAASNKIWIGTVASNGKAYMYEWNGAATTVTRAYRLEAQAVLACVIKDDIPWIVDSNGRLCAYSGGTFKEMARFPTNNKFLLSSTNTINNRSIHPNGMSVVNGKINILFNNIIDDSASSVAEFCPSGIWEYDENIGLYHKSSLSYLPVGTNTITDYGQNRVSGVGGLSDMKLSESSAASTGNLIAGAVIYTNASSTDAGVFTNDTFDAVTGTTGQKATQAFGYLVTTKISSSEIQDAWQKLVVFHEKFLTTSDKIIVKYRTSEIPAIEASITWLTTTSFTTSTDVSSFLKGDEVEITQGTGGGLCAHISNIQTGAASTYIVTLDETFTGVSTGTAKARFQKWVKAGTIQDKSTFDKVKINTTSDYIQLKVAMLSTGKNEIGGLALINKVKQLAQ